MGPALEPASVLREYFPLVTDGGVRGVVGVWRDAGPILAQLDEMRRNVVLVTLSAALVACAASCSSSSASAQGRISRQTAGAHRRRPSRPADRPTQPRGAVDAVAAAGRARPRPRVEPFSVALVDVDNFRTAERDLRARGRRRRPADRRGGPDARGATDGPHRPLRTGRADAARPGGRGRPTCATVVERLRADAGRHVRSSSRPRSSCR